MSIENNIKGAEKRKHIRHSCEADIEWSYFNTGAYFDGKLLNFSRGGVYIETAHDIMLGATIIIRLGNVHRSAIELTDYEYPRLVSLGEVAWRADISEKQQPCRGAGVRYPITA